MNITLYVVGKVKETFYREAIAEYSKRLSRYCNLKIIEVSDEKTPDQASIAQERQIRQKEGRRLLEKISDTAYLVALLIDGKSYQSVAFAEHIQQLTVSGYSEISFVIGGSLGLSDEVKERADEHLSFSDFTFPHQLMRIILLEQIYRAFRIIRHEPYHK